MDFTADLPKPHKPITINHKLFFKKVYFFSNSILWEHINVQPINLVFQPDIARKKMGVFLNALPCLFCGKALNRKVSSFAKNVA